MKFIWDKKIDQSLKVLMNRMGYHEHFNRKTGQLSYIRRLSNLGYPRFHLIIEKIAQGLEFRLHLDEKKVSYKGQKAHSGQDDGQLVMQELERIEAILSK